MPEWDDTPEDNNMRRLVDSLRAFIEIQEMQGGPESMNRDEILARATADTDAFVGVLEPCPDFSLVVYKDRIDLQVIDGVCATWRREINADRVQAIFDGLIAEVENDGEGHGYIAAKIRGLEQVAAGFHHAMINDDDEKMSKALVMFMVDTYELFVLVRRLLDNNNVPAIFAVVAEPGDLKSTLTGFIETNDPEDRQDYLLAFMQETCGFFASFGSNEFMEDMVTQIIEADNPTDAQNYFSAFMQETCRLFVRMLRLHDGNP